MFEQFRGAVSRLLRVPQEPSIPEVWRVIRVFRAAPNYFRYRTAIWAVGQVTALAGLVLSFIFMPFILRWVPGGLWTFLVQLAEVAAWLTFVVQLPVGLAVLRLDLEMRWYILSDRSLRIHEGILNVREKTVTFANIQEISIRQNPIQRLLGISDVKVRTAGGGSGGSNPQQPHVGESMHEAYFRGVDNADEIRNAIRERVRLHRDTGLGDPDEPAAPSYSSEPEVLEAAQELHTEVRRLGASVLAGRQESL